MTDLVHTYRPRGSAVELLHYRGPEVVLSGPAGTGKSRVCLTKIHLACLKTPGVRALVVRKTGVSLGSSTLVTYREKVAAEAIEAGTVRFYSGSPSEAASYQYDNGSVIVVGGMDRADKVLSTEYDLIFADEVTELAEKDWQTLLTRLRHGKLSFQQAMAACNPGPPKHWAKIRSRSSLKMIESRHIDNPAYFNADGSMTPEGTAYMATLDSLTGVHRLRLRDGVWAAAEGIIYDEFDPALHVVRRFEVPEDWPRDLVVDFGFKHPFVAQWWAQDPDGGLVMYREIYMTERLVEDHARQIVRLSADDPPLRSVIADHHAENRASLERHLGIEVTPAKKTVKDGIDAVKARLKVQGDGRARMFFMEDSLVEPDHRLADEGRPTCTVDEFGMYIWDPRRPDQPLKVNDDGMDCVRYRVAECDLQETRGIQAVSGSWM